MAPEKETAVNQVTAALNGLDTAALKAMLLQFQQLSGDAQTMMGSVKSLTDALYNADAPSDQNTVVGAAGALAAGAQSAQDGAASLRDGAAQLTAGAAQLSNGASSLSAGLTQLSGASKTVRDAIGQFRTGAGSLNDGAAQLQDGLDTYASQAIGKLTELAGSADTSALQDVLKALETRAQSYTSYTGSADGVRANVKFVMKTAGLPEEETTSSSDTEDSEAAPQDKTPDASFWDRVKNLFS
jgi:X-X-X-Leu-X-X-Gly heptad repeat protein